MEGHVDGAELALPRPVQNNLSGGLPVFGFQWNIVWFQLDIQSANVCHNSFSKGLAIKAFAMNACQHIGYHWLLFRIHMASAAINVTRVEK